MGPRSAWPAPPWPAPRCRSRATRRRHRSMRAWWGCAASWARRSAPRRTWRQRRAARTASSRRAARPTGRPLPLRPPPTATYGHRLHHVLLPPPRMVTASGEREPTGARAQREGGPRQRAARLPPHAAAGAACSPSCPACSPECPACSPRCPSCSPATLCVQVQEDGRQTEGRSKDLDLELVSTVNQASH